MMNVYVANLGKYNEGYLVGQWLELPATEEEINEVFVKIKLGHYDEEGEYIHGYEEDYSIYEEYAIHDYECDIEGVKISEYSSLSNLNEIAEQLEELDESDKEKLEAIVEYQGGDILDYIDELDDYILYSDICDEYDLGYYWIQESGCYDLKSMGNLANYFDYEKFGRDITYDGNGTFTKYGWLEAC